MCVVLSQFSKKNLLEFLVFKSLKKFTFVFTIHIHHGSCSNFVFQLRIVLGNERFDDFGRGKRVVCLNKFLNWIYLSIKTSCTMLVCKYFNQSSLAHTNKVVVIGNR